MTTDLVVIEPTEELLLPTSLFSPTPHARKRVAEFFTTQINNDHTRRAYVNAARRFSEWCALRGVAQLPDVEPIHVAAFVKDLQAQLAPPTAKQHLAAVRMLFDWLVTGHVLNVNPAHAVRGPKYVVKKGQDAGAARRRGPPAPGLHRHRLAHRTARSCAYRHHGLHLRPCRRRAADESR